MSNFKAGQSFRAYIPFSAPNTSKVYIDHVLPSIHKGKCLIVYRVYGKHKQWWHEFMCTNTQMGFYRELGQIKK